jgi:hypothetical protein
MAKDALARDLDGSEDRDPLRTPSFLAKVL